MVDTLNSYETVFVVSALITEEQENLVVEKIKSLIQENAQLGKVDKWGKRKLAYMIDKKHTDGIYYLVTFKSNNEFPRELERNYSIIDEIIRFLVIRKEV